MPRLRQTKRPLSSALAPARSSCFRLPSPAPRPRRCRSDRSAAIWVRRLGRGSCADDRRTRASSPCTTGRTRSPATSWSPRMAPSRRRRRSSPLARPSRTGSRSAARRWLAVRNHNTHDVLVFERAGLHADSDPVGVLRGRRLSARTALRARRSAPRRRDAGAPYVDVFERAGDTWATALVSDDEHSRHGRRDVRDEVIATRARAAPKGLDLAPRTEHTRDHGGDGSARVLRPRASSSSGRRADLRANASPTSSIDSAISRQRQAGASSPTRVGQLNAVLDTKALAPDEPAALRVRDVGLRLRRRG